MQEKQGRIHDNPVTQRLGRSNNAKTARNFRNISYRHTNLPTYRPTRQGVESRVHD